MSPELIADEFADSTVLFAFAEHDGTDEALELPDAPAPFVPSAHARAPGDVGLLTVAVGGRRSWPSSRRGAHQVRRGTTA